MKKQEEKVGKISIKDIQSKINKKLKNTSYNAFTLENGENPTKIRQWISTGAVWLDAIIAKGMMGGIPVGRATELAGLESTGKSYLAALICASAQKLGIIPVYFDSEWSIDPSFWTNLGIKEDEIIFIPAHSVEFVFETIKDMIKDNPGTQFLFVLDSLANTPTKSSEDADEVNPGATVSQKARIASEAMQQLTIPLGEGQHTLLVLNQLKTRVGTTETGAMIGRYTPDEDKWFTPGGKALHYAYSLRIWLKRGNAKKEFITNENGFRIGAEVKAKLKKCRFGTEGRECRFKIVWGDDQQVGVRNIESILEAIQTSEKLKSGTWSSIEGTDFKWQKSGFEKKYLEDEPFRKCINEIFEEETIHKFKDKRGNAKDFYDVPVVDEDEKEDTL